MLSFAVLLFVLSYVTCNLYVKCIIIAYGEGFFHCGPDYLSYIPDMKKINYECKDVPGSISVKPNFNAYMSIEYHNISGSPHKPMPLTKYVLTSGSSTNDVFVIANYKLSELYCGSQIQVIYKDVPFLPFRCFANSYVEYYQISPELPDGLELNNSTSEITGLYHGSPTQTEFTITAINGDQSISQKVTFQFKDQSAITNRGISLCNYKEASGTKTHTPLWYDLTGAEHCTFISSIDLEEKKGATVHTWPGLDDTFTQEFGSFFTGYLDIKEDHKYTISITTQQAFSLYIDSDKPCYVAYESRSVSTSRVSLDLSQGYHLFRLYWSNGNYAPKLTMKIGKDIDHQTIVSTENCMIAGKAPMLLTIPSVYSVVNTPIHSVPSPYSGSTIDSFTISPILPPGLTFDIRTGSIDGMLTTSYYGEFTITASNQFGLSLHNIVIAINNQFLPGLSAQYYQISKPVSICAYDEFPKSILTLIVDQVDKNLDHPYQSGSVAWDTVPGYVFNEKNFVRWTGFLKVDRIGKYRMYAKAVDGIRIRIQDLEELKNWRCSDSPNVVDKTVDFNRAGLYAIEIEWFKDNENINQLQLMWAYEKEELSIISENAFYHIPQHAFAYQHQQVIYIKDKEIEGNKPYVFGLPSIPSDFSITPPLPAGLNMDMYGAITGKPTEATELTSYTITARVNIYTMTTVISMQVVNVLAPSNIQLKTVSGQVLSEIDVNLFEIMTNVKVLWDGPNAQMRIEPGLPEGIEVNKVSNIISGRPLVRADKQPFTIIVYNDYGEARATYNFTVKGCPYGKSFFTDVSSTQHIAFKIINNDNETVVNVNNIPPNRYGLVICLNPEYTYTFNAFCKDSYIGCSLTVIREDKMVFMDRRELPKNEWINDIFPLVATEKPVFITKLKRYTALPDLDVELTYRIEGIHGDTSITPELPSGMYFDKDTRKVKGHFTEEGNYVYTISTFNDAGEVHTTLQFDIGVCNEHESLYKAWRLYGSSQEEFRLIDSKTNETLYIHTFDHTEALRYFCLLPQEYTIIMKSKSSWNKENPLILYDFKNTMLSTFVQDSEEGIKSQSFIITNLIAPQSRLMYYRDDKQPRRNWKLEDFNTKNWEEASSPYWGEFTNELTTVYYRHFFTVPSGLYFPSFNIFIQGNGGICVYLNGNEILRLNLPSTDLDYSTEGIHEYDLTKGIQFTLTSDYLKQGTNILAIELHRFFDYKENESIIFDMHSIMINQESLLVSEQGIITSSHHNITTSDPTKAFDGKVTTYWQDEIFPVSIRYSYPSNRLVAINRLTIIGGIDYGFHQVATFILYGIRNVTIRKDQTEITKEQKDILVDINNPFIFTSPAHRATYNIDSIKAYSAYELEISGSNDGEDMVQVFELALYSDRNHYCYQDKAYQTARASEISYVPCSWTKIGLKTRICKETEEGGIWEPENDDTCLTRFAGKQEAFIDVEYKLYNATVSMYNGKLSEPLLRMFTRELMVKRAYINLYVARLCSIPADLPAVCFRVRITPHYLVSEYVMMQLMELNQNIKKRFYEDASASIHPYINFEIIEQPKLRQRPTTSTIVAIVAVSIIAISVIAFIIYYLRVSVKRKSDKTRKLSKKSSKSVMSQKSSYIQLL